MSFHIHIIGICGTFMGGLARIAQQKGFKVTGCDKNIYPPMSTQLEELGIELYSGFEAEQLTEYSADLYVIGNVATRGMPVVEAILNQNLPYTSGPSFLHDHVLTSQKVLAVAGTHGKTTTASILTWILEYAGFNPNFLIGGVASNFNVSARFNELSEYFVIEADEYDTAFFDKRSKFVHYKPYISILNNLEFDHADIFPDLKAIETQFHHLVRLIPNNGLIVANAGYDALERVLNRGCWTDVAYFNAENNQNNQIKYTISQEKDVLCVTNAQTKQQYKQSWALLGKHNQDNALACILASEKLGIPLETALSALGEFKTIKRRMEVKGMVQNITVYDDFAHHPTAIKTTLQGMKTYLSENKESGKIIAVLEPRSNTMQLGTLQALLADSLTVADAVFTYTNGVSWNVEQVLSGLPHSYVADDLEKLIDKLIQKINHFQHEDYSNEYTPIHVICMSNGSFQGIHDKILQRLQK